MFIAGQVFGDRRNIGQRPGRGLAEVTPEAAARNTLHPAARLGQVAGMSGRTYMDMGRPPADHLRRAGAEAGGRATWAGCFRLGQILKTSHPTDGGAWPKPRRGL